MTTVLITGASGFLAGHIARHFAALDCRIVGVTRDSEKAITGFDQLLAGRLGEAICAAQLGMHLDLVVHTALDAQSAHLNRIGTVAWAEDFAKCGAPLQIFISSVSALAPEPSSYGLQKREVESWFLAQGHTVIRPGLVVGRGGLFGRLLERLRRWPIIPLIGGGSQTTHVTGLDDVVNAIGTIADSPEQHEAHAYNLQLPTPPSLRELLQETCSACGFHRAFMPIPEGMVRSAVALAERIPFIRLPVTSTNLEGLANNAKMQVESDYLELLQQPGNLADLISRNLRV